MNHADVMLQSAMTFRESPRRTASVDDVFESHEVAVETWMDVVLHEASLAMSRPLEARPECPYLHPVDLDTADPGIVSDRESYEIRRTAAASVPRLKYHSLRPSHTHDEASEPAPPTFSVSEKVATTKAAKTLERELRCAERKSATALRAEEKKQARREERLNESAEQKLERLKVDRDKRRAREQKKRELEPPPPEAEGALRPGATPSARKPIPLEPDASFRSLVAAPARRRKKGQEKYFEHPLPNHRLLEGLRLAAPHPSLRPALLRNEACDGLEVIQGPPGTGKTNELARAIRDTPGRVFACAYTNVGAANLYERCVREGLGSECALVVAPDRVPPGVVVMSTDRTRRILCGTISGRCGPHLHDVAFASVFVDEAAQCTEAALWTLLRPEVERVVLAGDVKQLPALCSEEGRRLVHDRSLMQRLVENGYGNTVTLTVQNRMAPEIMALCNRLVYASDDTRLVCGPHAPTHGTVEVIHLPQGREEADGSSFRNRAEVEAVLAIPDLAADAVLLCPYAAQCKLLLSKGTSRPVHTIDSFQGHEADTVVLTMVRDGSSGLGFWCDLRRVNVALTRARTRLVLIVSNADGWKSHPLHEVIGS